MYKHLIAFTSLILLIISCNNDNKKTTDAKLQMDITASAQTNSHPLDDSKVIFLGLHSALDKLSLGWGVDFENASLLKQTPFKPITKKNIKPVPKVSIDIFITKTSEEETSDFEYDTKLEATIPLIGGGGDLRMIAKTIKASKKQDVKLVILAESEYEPETPELGSMTLTDTAESLRNNPAAFINFYGNFYCSEIYRGHKIKVEAILSRTLSSQLETYFQEGNVKVKFDFLGGGARNTIRNQVRKAATNQRSDIKVRSYGGIDPGDYGRRVSDLLQRDTTFEALIQYTTDLLTHINYGNSRIVRCVLSDYSTWGIPGFPILNAEKIAAQKKLKKLYSEISIEITNCDVLVNNPVFGSSYSRGQIEIARQNSLKYAQLRNRVTDAHKKLNKGDTSQLYKESGLRAEFNELKKATPEVFEFIASRQPGMPVQFLRPPGNPGIGFDKIMSTLVSTHLFNTSNTLTAFNHIASVSFFNNYTNTTIGEAVINNVTADKMLKHDGVNYVPLAMLLNPGKMQQFALGIDNDMMNVFMSFLQNGPAPTDKMNYNYLLVLKDKSDRIYSFPFFEVNFELNNPSPGFNGFVTQILPENCCTFLPDYEEPENILTNSPDVPEKSPGTINFSLKNFNFPFSDTLVLEITTDNPLVNRQLQDDGEDKISIPKNALMDPNNPISGPLEPLVFKYNFSEFILTFYSKNKRNEIDSEKHQMKVPYFRKLCAQTIYLQTDQ